jgi:ubiquinone/menaquinone biosynthesis C-methylase UbiE
MRIYERSLDVAEFFQWHDPLSCHLGDWVVRLVGPPAGRLLEVGCGTARTAVALARAGWSVDAVDSNPAVVAHAEALARRLGVGIRFFAADFSRPDPRFADASYTAVVCSEVIEHVGNWREVLDQIARVVRPGGVLVLTTPSDPHRYGPLDAAAGHLRRYAWSELASGLSTFSIDRAFTVGFPFTRALQWLYTRVALPALGRRHDPERLWRSRSPRLRAAATLARALVRCDDLFNRLRWGTTWVVVARRLQPPGLPGETEP